MKIKNFKNKMSYGLVLLWTVLVLLLVNFMFIQSAVVSTVLAGVYAVLIVVCCFKYFHGIKGFLTIVSLGSLTILVNIFFLYFFALDTFSIITSLIIPLVILSVLLYRGDGHDRIEHENPSVDAPFSSQLVIMVLVGIFIISIVLYAYVLYTIHAGPHIYDGRISRFAPLPMYILLIAFIALFLMYFQKKNRTLIIAGVLIIYLLSASSIIIAVDNLYGADSWRHLAVENYVSTGKTYEPTSIPELLKFQSEKIPNVSLYATVALISRLTQIQPYYVHLYFPLYFIVPGILFVLLFSARDLFRSWKAGLLLSLIVLISPGILFIIRNTSVQSIGIIFFLVNLWIWIRYVLDKDERICFHHWFITPLALIAYPTTGYFSLVVVVMSLIAKKWLHKNNVFSPWVYVVPLSIFFSVPIIFLDIFLKKIPIDSSVLDNWNGVWSLVLNWYHGLVPAHVNNPGLFPFIILFIIVAYVWLYKNERHRLFPFCMVVFFSLIIVQILSGLFDPNVPAIFSDRVNNLLHVTYFLFASLGIFIFIRKVVVLNRRLYFVSLAIILGALFAQFHTENAINFGWSISNNEVEAIKYIERNYKDSNYVVLADEVTEAAGNALSGFQQSKYYWYPSGFLYESYITLLNKPNKNLIENICETTASRFVFFINTPIPLTVSYPASISEISKIMKEIWILNNVTVYQYTCEVN